MAKPTHTTLKTLINTADNVRVLGHQLLNSPSPSAALTASQIRMLLNSPFQSLVKDQLFTIALMAFVYKQHQLAMLDELIKKLGMEDAMRAYYRELAQLEAQEYRVYLNKIEEDYRKSEETKESFVNKLKIEIGDLSRTLSKTMVELSLIQAAQNQIGLNAVQTNNAHIQAVNAMAINNGVSLREEWVPTLVPRAHRDFHRAQTPQEQIRALAALTSDNETMNNMVRLKHFIATPELAPAMRSYEKRVEQLNNEFSQQTQLLAQKKLHCLSLEQEIDRKQRAIDRINALPNRPVPMPLKDEIARELANQSKANPKR